MTSVHPLPYVLKELSAVFFVSRFCKRNHSGFILVLTLCEYQVHRAHESEAAHPQ
jgi:hypothetical protein